MVVRKMNLVKIVTHHKYPDEAAEMFAREGIVAIGWSEFGDIRKLTYDDIKRACVFLNFFFECDGVGSAWFFAFLRSLCALEPTPSGLPYDPNMLEAEN